MTKRMLIDGTHAEETRVVVLDGNRLEDFDVETSTKKQLKGNIYLAKIVRVEPSLQAAFVEYGASRHGFLAFGEIHPDYYQIPVADRQRLIAQQEQEAREAEAAEDAAAAQDADAEGGPASGEAGGDAGGGEGEPALASTPEPAGEHQPPGVQDAGNQEPPSGSGLPIDDAAEVPAEPALADWPVAAQPLSMERDEVLGAEPEQDGGQAVPYEAVDYSEKTAGEQTTADPMIAELGALGLQVGPDGRVTGDADAMAGLRDALDGSLDDRRDEALGAPDPASAEETGFGTDGSAPGELAPPSFENAAAMQSAAGEQDQAEERERRTPSPRYLRHYKIQEVIRRRQIMLVQVVKEERGGKGAALTTYISLAGRFCVLMPNSPRGGGISRKITSAADRRRLKEITTELEIPSGMGLIVRTAGAARPKPEIRRDCEYLLQLWDDIRDTTMKSVAPAAIYEEASLIKRAIRDVYARDVDEVQVDGQAAWHAARDQMRLLMPSHAHKVQLWQDPNGQPLFAHHQVDAQLDAMLSPNVQLRSGGYLVINQTEALVAIDVNSGRSTRERGIEETALRTNMEAAEEVARQLRLRDLAGLIVIDFIDMEVRRNNAQVERKLADALKNDRARIQLGSISQFGLMEMSRQRLRPSLTETNFVQCPHCLGAGHVRSTEGSAIHVLRAIEEEGAKRRAAEIMVHVAGPIAMYILNHKRDRIAEIEARSGMVVLFTPDPTLLPPAVKIERLRTHAPGEAPPIAALLPPTAPMPAHDDPLDEADLEDDEPAGALGTVSADDAPPGGGVAGGARSDESAEGGRRRRRRRRRGGRRDDAAAEGELPPLAQPGADQPSQDQPGRDQPGAADEARQASDMPVFEPGLDTGDVAGAAETGEAPSAGMHDPADGGADGGERGTGRRRGRRGGRRRRGETVAGEETPPVPEQVTGGYVGPTPADPFGGGSFDIFDALEQAEAFAERQLASAAPAATQAAMPEPRAESAPATLEPTIQELAIPAPAIQAPPVPKPELPAAAPALEGASEDPPPAPSASPAPAKRVRAPRAASPRRPAKARTPELPIAPADASGTDAVPEMPPKALTPPVPEVAPEGAPESVPMAAAAPQAVDGAPAAPRKGWWKR